MLTLEQIKKRLKDRNLKKVSVVTGISYPAVWNIANKNQEKVQYRTVKMLSDYLEEYR